MSISIKIFGSVQTTKLSEVESLDFCFCGIDCNDSYKEKAFASNSDNEYEKDKSSFLLSKVIDSDTISFEIWKGNTKVADVIDNTYGDYYPTFASKQLYVGFVADWTLISAYFGFGYYRIKASRNLLGQSKPFESRLFHVLPYSEELADNTVRIETYMNANVLGDDLDLSDLIEGGWYRSIRLDGRFGDESILLQEDNYENSQREVVDIQPLIEKSYKLFTNYLNSNIRAMLMDNLLSTSMFVTDFNLINDSIYRRISVRLSDIDDVSHAGRSTAYVLNFKDRKNDNLIVR